MTDPVDPDLIARMQDLVAMRTEPLHPDLQPYLMESPQGLPILGHPLVHHVMPTNGHANRVYEQKKQLLEEAQAKGDWHYIIHCLIERPYRCDALIDYVLGRDEDGVPFSMVDLDLSEEMRDLVAFVWTDSENIHQHVDDWLAITDGHKPGDPLLMGEQAEFDALPTDEDGMLEVWRGDCDDGGWSWSLERKVAEFFADRWSANHALLHGFVEKQYVFGYLTSRSESEVMVRREHVRDLVITVRG